MHDDRVVLFSCSKAVPCCIKRVPCHLDGTGRTGSFRPALPSTWHRHKTAPAILHCLPPGQTGPGSGCWEVPARSSPPSAGRCRCCSARPPLQGGMRVGWGGVGCMRGGGPHKAASTGTGAEDRGRTQRGVGSWHAYVLQCMPHIPCPSSGRGHRLICMHRPCGRMQAEGLTRPATGSERGQAGIQSDPSKAAGSIALKSGCKLRAAGVRRGRQRAQAAGSERVVEKLAEAAGPCMFLHRWSRRRFEAPLGAEPSLLNII